MNTNKLYFSRKTLITIKPKFYLIYRTYPGGKEVGHVAKVLNSMSKMSAVSVPSQTATLSQQSLTSNNTTTTSTVSDKTENIVPVLQITAIQEKANVHPLQQESNTFQQNCVNGTLVNTVKPSENTQQNVSDNAQTIAENPTSNIIENVVQQAFSTSQRGAGAGITASLNRHTSTTEVIPTVFSNNNHATYTTTSSKQPFSILFLDGNLSCEDLYDMGYFPTVSPIPPTSPSIQPALQAQTETSVTVFSNDTASKDNTTVTTTFTIPSPPPMPPLPNNTNPNPQPLTFADAIKTAAAEINTSSKQSGLNANLQILETQQEFKKQNYIREATVINDLFNAYLLMIEHTDYGKNTGGYKLTGEFFNLVARVSTDKQSVGNLSSFNITQDTLEAGVLQVIELYQESSVFLQGIQNHLAIAIPINKNQFIVFGFLTSSKTDTVFLSNDQLLSNNKDKAQMFKPIDPLIVEKDHIKIHPEGIAYVSEENIKEALFKNLKEKINNNEMCYKYVPKGISVETLQAVIALEKQENELKFLKALISYENDIKQMQNQLNEQQFIKWKKQRDDTLSKVYKCDWPHYAEQIKQKHEDK